MQMYGMMSMFKIAEETGEELKSHDFELVGGTDGRQCTT